MSTSSLSGRLGRWPDRLGAFVSITCGLHCAAMSLLVVLYPTIWATNTGAESGLLEEIKHLEDWLFVLAWFFAVIAMGLAWFSRRTLGPPLLAALGLALLTVALKSELHEYALAGSLTALTGGIIIACAHWWNLRAIKTPPAVPAHSN
ncbi:MAG: MerC domain-containing protein [Pseudomonadota bacterium]